MTFSNMRAGAPSQAEAVGVHDGLVHRIGFTTRSCWNWLRREIGIDVAVPARTSIFFVFSFPCSPPSLRCIAEVWISFSGRD